MSCHSWKTQFLSTLYNKIPARINCTRVPFSDTAKLLSCAADKPFLKAAKTGNNNPSVPDLQVSM